jgi:CDP-paratose 2-epimerase
MISAISGKEMRYKYDDGNRIGDHICYYSNLAKIKEHYPGWSITKSLKTTFEEIYKSWLARN